MRITIKLLLITIILVIYSCYDNNKETVKVQALNNAEDTISTEGFILYYDSEIKYSLFVPVIENINENNILKFKYFQTQYLGVGFQFFPAEDNIWDTINLNKERFLVKKYDTETKVLISDTLNVLFVKAKVERQLRNLKPERIYEDNFKIMLNDKSINFKYTNRYLQNILEIKVIR